MAKTPVPRPRLLTRRQLAALPDLPGQDGPVHMQTVTKWERAGLPLARRGRRGRPSLYREDVVRAWLIAREEAARGPEALNLEVERARKEHWQAQLAEQLHKARSRELLPRLEVERTWSAQVAAVRAKLLAFPATHADRIYRAATLNELAGVELVLAAAVREVLLELAADGQAEPPAGGKRRARARKSRAA